MQVYWLRRIRGISTSSVGCAASFPSRGSPCQKKSAGAARQTDFFGQKQQLRSQTTTELLWWTIQDSNLRTQPQAACIRGDPSGRSPDSNSHKFESVLLNKSKNSAVKRLRSYCGGRYKTRTCDLPHVKRMRYQLRQSSSSLSARGILYHKKRIVKIFLREPFAFCSAEAAKGIIAGKAQIMTP